MDFDLHFTEEDERFRTEVRKWLEENAPADMEWPPDPYDSKPEMVQKRTDMTRKLGAKGWYAPDWPKEYGGGGLSGERVTILQQEFNRISEERGWGGVFGFTSDIVPGTLLKYGPEELRREILTGILRGEISWWLNETEPEHGTDNAALESTAIQDGDHYIVNGEKIYVGREEPVNWRDTWLFTPLVTKPGAPRHENLGTFVFPASLPGIEAEVLPLIGAEAIKWRLHMKNVQVPAKYLIGGPEANGWEVLQYSLRAEHGGGGRIATRPSLSSKLIRYCKEAKRNGKPLSSDPFVQDTLVRLWIEDEKARLYGLSTYWTGKSGEWAGVGYKAVQGALHQKTHAPKLAKAILDILGPYAVASSPELRVLTGEVERAERMGCVTHIAGTPESMKILAARGIGMTRAKEKGGK